MKVKVKKVPGQSSNKTMKVKVKSLPKAQDAIWPGAPSTQQGLELKKPTYHYSDSPVYDDIYGNQDYKTASKVDNVVMPNYQVQQNEQITPQAPSVPPPSYTQKKKTNVKFKGLGLPTSGNPYINRGFTYGNQAMGHFMNASRLNKGEKIEPEDLYQSTYFGPTGSGLNIEIEKAQFGAALRNTNFGNLLKNTNVIEQFSNMDPAGQQNVIGALNLGQSVGNFAKGITDEIGTNIVNNQELARNAKQFSQAVANSAQDVTPYETQGYSFQGRNSLSYGGYAADGMQIRQIGGMGEPNVEVEGREHIKLPNGFSQEIKGKKHSEGGIPLNLPQGTQIFSEKLKDPETKKSYADLAKKFETKKYVDLLNSKAADPIQKATAQMMIQQNNARLEQLFALQEQNKLSGVHGPQVQQNAMEQMEESKAQEQQESQQEQSMEQEPMMKHGGYHLPQAEGGQFIWSNKPRYQTYNDNVTKETGYNITTKPTWQQRDLGEWDKAVGYNVGDLSLDPTVRKHYENLPGKDVAAALYQETMYDDYLDKMQYGTSEEKKAALEGMRKMWKEAGSTNYGLQKGIKTKGINLDTAGYEEFNKLRPAFIDARGQYRYLNPFKAPLPQPTTPAAKTPAQETTTATPEVAPQTPENITNQNIYANLAFDIPRNYERSPLNYYALKPEFIEPRYLDIQPQLNAIARAQRAVQSNIGSRGTTDISNLLQAQQNASAAQQQAFGTKYGYDRGQDAAAQQFNAEAKMKMDMYNQGSWYQQLEDPIRRREAAIEQQKMLDRARAQENAMLQNQYGVTRGFLDKSINPYKNMSLADFISALNSTNKEELTKKSKTEQAGKKYGGKVKIKPKFRK